MTTESDAYEYERVCIEVEHLREQLARVTEALGRDAYGSTWCVVCQGAREALADNQEQRWNSVRPSSALDKDR